MIANHTQTQPDTQPLAGQVGLVTGGGRGFGRSFALALARAGMAVAVTAHTESEIQATVQEIEKAVVVGWPSLSM